MVHIKNYVKTINTLSGLSVRIVYFDNLHYDGQELREVEKPHVDNQFSNFLTYKTFLLSKLTQIRDNATSFMRKMPMSLLSTISTGYDSVAVSALVQSVGVSEALTFKRSRGGYLSMGGKDDSGTTIAQYLGLRTISGRRDSFKKAPDAEIDFFCFDPDGEDTNFATFRDHLTKRMPVVLFTGFNGDKVWDIHRHNVSPEIVRGDTTGLGLCEFRLRAGFVHCPVPFIGILDAGAIYQISNSIELKPWSLGNDYDRPICRRIAEEAGVPRDKFGVHKKATSILYESPIVPSNKSARRSFYTYLLERKVCTAKYLILIKFIRVANRFIDPFQAGYWRIRRKTFSKIKSRIDGLTFPWAAYQCKSGYRKYGEK